MPCFLSPPPPPPPAPSPPPFSVSSSQPHRRSLLPESHRRKEEEETRTDETQKLGKPRALATLPLSSKNPAKSTSLVPNPICWIGGGSPIRNKAVLACGRSCSVGGKITPLPMIGGTGNFHLIDRHCVIRDKDVFFVGKGGNLPTKAVADVHSVKEVEMASSAHVSEKPRFVDGAGGTQAKALAEVFYEDGNRIHSIQIKDSRKKFGFVEEMNGRPEELWKLESVRARGILTIGYLIDRISNLHCGQHFQDLLYHRQDEILTMSDFNELLLTSIRHGELEFATSLFSELPMYSLSPNCWSFSIMIQCFCKKNEPDKAKDVFYDMMHYGFKPTTVLFTNLIHCFCKKGRLQLAYELFEIMGRVGCHPTIQTYNCLINGLCYVGRIEEAFQLLKKIRKSAIEPDIYTFTTVVDGFCKVGRTDEAIELLNDGLELGIKPNIVTFNSLINGFCKEGRPLEGVGLLRDMKSGGCQPDQISYGTILQGLLKCGEASTALKIYQEMREIGLKVDGHVMNTLLRGICRKCMINPELLKEVEGFAETITRMGHRLSPYTYCLMVQVFANAGHTSKALAHLNEMERIGYPPRTKTYDMVIRVLFGEGRVDDAFLVLILMLKANRIPSAFSCNRLLNEFNQQGRFLDACSVFAAALKQGVVLCQEPRKGSKEGQKTPSRTMRISIS